MGSGTGQRPLSEVSPMAQRRNSPVWNQNTKVRVYYFMYYVYWTDDSRPDDEEQYRRLRRQIVPASLLARAGIWISIPQNPRKPGPL